MRLKRSFLSNAGGDSARHWVTLILATSGIFAFSGQTAMAEGVKQAAGTAHKSNLPTASDAGSRESDEKLMQRVRQVLVDDKSLSTAAHNLTVVANHGVVTLRGNVKDETEKAAVLAKVGAIVPAANLNTTDLKTGI